MWWPAVCYVWPTHPATRPVRSAATLPRPCGSTWQQGPLPTVRRQLGCPHYWGWPPIVEVGQSLPGSLEEWGSWCTVPVWERAVSSALLRVCEATLCVCCPQYDSCTECCSSAGARRCRLCVWCSAFPSWPSSLQHISRARRCRVLHLHWAILLLGTLYVWASVLRLWRQQPASPSAWTQEQVPECTSCVCPVQGKRLCGENPRGEEGQEAQAPGLRLESDWCVWVVRCVVLECGCALFIKMLWRIPLWCAGWLCAKFSDWHSSVLSSPGHAYMKIYHGSHELFSVVSVFFFARIDFIEKNDEKQRKNTPRS